MNIPMHPLQQRAYELARAEIGTKEIRGSQHNPDVVEYFADAGHSWVKDDETAWCAAFTGAMLERAGLPSTRKLNARSYLDWGESVRLEDAQPGDIVIYWRGAPSSWQGHVHHFVRREGAWIIGVGGNQANMVNEAAYPVSQLLGVRRMRDPNPPKPENPDPVLEWLRGLLRKLRGGK